MSAFQIVQLVFMCFAIPFAIISGIAVPVMIGQWLEKRLKLKP